MDRSEEHAVLRIPEEEQQKYSTLLKQYLMQSPGASGRQELPPPFTANRSDVYLAVAAL